MKRFIPDIPGPETNDPTLATAVQLGDRMIDAGFAWASAREALGAVAAELSELATELDASPRAPERIVDELGDVIFTAALLAAHVRRDVPQLCELRLEDALRGTLQKFCARFDEMERLMEADCVKRRGTPAPEMPRSIWAPYWHRAKIRAGSP